MFKYKRRTIMNKIVTLTVISLFLLVGCTTSPTLITEGLIVDLDADKDVTLEDGNMVSKWKNQIAEFPAQDFAQRDKGRDIPGSGRPTLKENIAELGGHNSLIFREDELINMNEDAFDHLITGSGYTWFTVMNAYAQVWKLKDVNVFFWKPRLSSRQGM